MSNPNIDLECPQPNLTLTNLPTASQSEQICEHWAEVAQTWAEGIDAAVALLGGTHSAKGWADVCEDIYDNINNNFVAKNQGVAQSGKVLGVGADGMVTCVEGGEGKVDKAQGAANARKVLATDASGNVETIYAPMFNKRDIITSSGNYTVPVTGWYKITAKGGGGGGGGSTVVSSFIKNGGGGGEGGTYIGYHKLTAGDTIACVVGASGTGGTTVSSGSQQAGANGGDSTVTIAGTIFTASGGVGSSFSGGAGGLGTIIGCPGTTGTLIQSSSAMRYGCCGGGAGGQNGPGRTGAGGGGGNYYSSTDKTNGYNGGSGYIWFEYFDPSL